MVRTARITSARTIANRVTRNELPANYTPGPSPGSTPNTEIAKRSQRPAPLYPTATRPRFVGPRARALPLPLLVLRRGPPAMGTVALTLLTTTADPKAGRSHSF